MHTPPPPRFSLFEAAKVLQRAKMLHLNKVLQGLKVLHFLKVLHRARRSTSLSPVWSVAQKTENFRTNVRTFV
jgi:hypothetical protein